MPAVPTALEAHERVGGHAATRQSVLVRAVIASYTQPTQIEIPIPNVKVEYVRTYLNADVGPGKTNGSVAFSYTIP